MIARHYNIKHMWQLHCFEALFITLTVFPGMANPDRS